MKKRPLLLLFTLLAVACLVTTAGAAEPMKIKFGHVAPPFHGQSKGVEALAQYVKEKTGGGIEIETFPFGQLGEETSLTEQVQTGTLEMATITTAVLQSYAPQVGVMDLPFVFPDRKTAYAVIDDLEVQEKLFGFLPDKGLVGIGWTENEFRDVTNSKREVRSPGDMRGLKIRVIKSPMYIDAFKALGASPVDLPFPEIYSALQNGTIDAQENPLLTSILIKATEITKYVTITNHVLTECIIIVNPDFWGKLTPDQQRIFREGAAEGIKVNREVNVRLKESLPKSGLSVSEFCEKNGVKVTELTPGEREVFRNAMSSVWEKYREKITPEVFDFFLAKVKHHAGGN